MRPWILSLDIAAIAVFIGLGRDTHGRDATVGGFLWTAAPFLIALAIGWVAARAWHAPTGMFAGGIVLATTIVAGMALRRIVFGDGIAPSFIVVTALFLALFMLGWRLIATWLWRRRLTPA